MQQLRVTQLELTYEKKKISTDHPRIKIIAGGALNSFLRYVWSLVLKDENS